MVSSLRLAAAAATLLLSACSASDPGTGSALPSHAGDDGGVASDADASVCPPITASAANQACLDYMQTSCTAHLAECQQDCSCVAFLDQCLRSTSSVAECLSAASPDASAEGWMFNCADDPFQQVCFGTD